MKTSTCIQSAVIKRGDTDFDNFLNTLSGNEVKVLFSLMMDGGCGRDEMSVRVGISVNTVKKCFLNLVTLGLVMRVRHGLWCVSDGFRQLEFRGLLGQKGSKIDPLDEIMDEKGSKIDPLNAKKGSKIDPLNAKKGSKIDPFSSKVDRIVINNNNNYIDHIRSISLGFADYFGIGMSADDREIWKHRHPEFLMACIYQVRHNKKNVSDSDFAKIYRRQVLAQNSRELPNSCSPKFHKAAATWLGMNCDQRTAFVGRNRHQLERNFGDLDLAALNAVDYLIRRSDVELPVSLFPRLQLNSNRQPQSRCWLRGQQLDSVDAIFSAVRSDVPAVNGE